MEIPPEVDITVVWDRSSAGFATCWTEKCQARTANGTLREQWEVAAGSRPMAFSVEAGLVTASVGTAEWRRGVELIPLDAVPAAAAFRAGTGELWLLDAAGHLAGRDQQGRHIGEGESVTNAIGLVSFANVACPSSPLPFCGVPPPAKTDTSPLLLLAAVSSL